MIRDMVREWVDEEVLPKIEPVRREFSRTNGVLRW